MYTSHNLEVRNLKGNITVYNRVVVLNENIVIIDFYSNLFY